MSVDEVKKKSEFLRVKRLGDHWEDYALSLERPFSKPSFLTDFLVKIFRNIAAGFEILNIGNIYVKKADSDFDYIPSRFHLLIKRLYEDGLLKHISLPKPIPEWPRIPALSLRFGNGSIASGYAMDWDTAATKALAELLEWSASIENKKKKFIIGSREDFKSKSVVDLESFIYFSQKQLAQEEYIGHRLNNDSKLKWIKCFSIIDGKKYLVPAQLVFLGREIFKEEPMLRQTTSNGGAAGISTAMALVHGLLEAIERDALIIHWLNKITPPKVDIDSLEIFGNETLSRVVNDYRKFGIDFTLLDITTDLGVPVFLTVIREKARGRPGIFLGAGADLDIESAIIHSLLEGLRAGYWSSVSEEQVEQFDKKAPIINNIEERRIYWCDKSRMSEADFLLSGPIKKIKKNEFRGLDNQNKMKHLKQILKAHGMEAYGVDCTTKVAQDAGLKIITTLVPELCYLYLNEHFKYLGTKRLYEAPVKMGVFKEPKEEEEMNPVPHPFL